MRYVIPVEFEIFVDSASEAEKTAIRLLKLIDHGTVMEALVDAGIDVKLYSIGEPRRR